MSELLDKQVNVQKEFENKTFKFHANLQKVCDENERKMTTASIFVKRRPYLFRGLVN